MAKQLPADASKANMDAATDDPEQALLVDCAGLVDLFNVLKAALGAGALLDVGDGMEAQALAGGTNDKIRVRMSVAAKSSAYTALAADRGKLIDGTSGSWVLAFTVAATLGDGWFLFVRNSGSGVITLDPNAAELIDGVATITLSGGESALVVCNGAAFKTVGRTAATPLPPAHLTGLGLGNNGTDSAHDIDIAAGKARDGADGENMSLTSTIVKRIDAAWAVGHTGGGLDTGTVANNAWYHLWLIKRTDTGVVDILFSTSATAPTMPTNYDKKRRLGAVRTDGAANILAFSQVGDLFSWDDPPLDVDDTAQSTSAIARTLSVPPGVACIARINYYFWRSSSGEQLYIRASASNDEAPSITSGPLANARNASPTADQVGTMEIQTDTNGQITTRGSNTSILVRISTLAWADRRGRDG